MKSKIIDISGKEKGSIELPKNFSSSIRSDIIQKVFEAEKMKQPFGTMYGAGANYSASGIIRHKRHAWKTGYGKGLARVPRKIMSRSGTSFNWIGATVSNTRGGRRAHPPKSEENQFRKINKKEWLMALNSALSATLNSAALSKKYTIKISKDPIFIFDSSVLSAKTKDFILTLKKILGETYERALQVKTVRAGKGKLRGRKYKKTAGLLFVIGSKEKMNRKGIDVVNVTSLDIRNLAPNGQPGRLTCYTEEAIKEIGEKFK